MRLALLLALVVLALPLAQATEPVTVRYVGKLPSPSGDEDGWGCAGPPQGNLVPKVGVGGACQLLTHAGRLHAWVNDTSHLPVRFTWTLRAGDHTACMRGNGTNTLVVDVPPGCELLDIVLDTTATTGTITWV